MPISEKIPDALVGERLDRVVAMIADCTRAQAVSLIESGRVELSGKSMYSKSHKVQKNQSIVIDDALLGGPAPPGADGSVHFVLVYQDDHLLVVDKPAGLVVHPGSGHVAGTLVNGLLARFPEIADVGESSRPGIVHRLDKDTSGLMVVARTGQSYGSLVSMLQSHAIGRIYTSLVHGSVKGAKGTVDAPIGRSQTRHTQMSLSASGRDALTNYEVKERFDQPMPATLLELTLETGRTHQIRVHMKAIGHPVFGDELYSRHNSGGLDRMFLHSTRLRFIHPVTRRHMEFESPLPEKLKKFLEAFK